MAQKISLAVTEEKLVGTAHTWRSVVVCCRQAAAIGRAWSLITSPLTQQGLDPIKLVYNSCQLGGQLKLTATAFNQLKSVCQQSWSQGTLLRRTRRFFRSGSRNHCQYLLHLPTARLSGPVKYWRGIPANTNWARRSLTLFMLPTPSPLRKSRQWWSISSSTKYKPMLYEWTKKSLSWSGLLMYGITLSSRAASTLW